jgi:hypothetical protein
MARIFVSIVRDHPGRGRRPRIVQGWRVIPVAAMEIG